MPLDSILVNRTLGLTIWAAVVAESEDFANDRFSGSVPAMVWGSASVTQSLFARLPVTAHPFGEPEVTSLDLAEDLIEADSVGMKPDRFDPERILASIPHSFRLLPMLMERSLCDEENTYRCPYGFLHSDVLTETQYGNNCMVCDFDFDNCYGKEISEGYIELHHTKLLCDLKPNEGTKIEDVIVVCSNCHRIIHRKQSNPIDWKVLKKIIKAKNQKGI
jgi:hypothetical protein